MRSPNYDFSELVKLKPAWVDTEDETTDVRRKRDGMFEEMLEEPSKKSNAVLDYYINAPDDNWVKIALLNNMLHGPQPAQRAPVVVHETTHLRSGKLKSKELQRIDHGFADGVGKVMAVDFCPGDMGDTLLSTDSKGGVQFTKVEDESNSVASKLVFNDFPITEAKWDAEGNRVVLLGPKKSIAELSVETGSIEKIPGLGGRTEDSYYYLLTPGPRHGHFFAVATVNGFVLVVDRVSKRLIRSFKMSSAVRGISILDDATLITTDSQGEIFWWDVGTGRCLARVSDNSSLSPTALTLTPLEAKTPFMAVGSSTGVVSLYPKELPGDEESLEPIKVFKNLTTTVSTLAVHPAGDMLFAASPELPNACRMVHIPSLSVFSNFPGSLGTQALGVVEKASFSSSGRYLSVLNSASQIRLLQLNHNKD